MLGIAATVADAASVGILYVIASGADHPADDGHDVRAPDHLGL